MVIMHHGGARGVRDTVMALDKGGLIPGGLSLKFISDVLVTH